MPGRKHDIVKVTYGDTWIAQFGIRRGKATQNHNYVAEQLHLTRQQALRLAKCALSREEYLALLVQRGIIEE